MDLLMLIVLWRLLAMAANEGFGAFSSWKIIYYLFKIDLDNIQNYNYNENAETFLKWVGGKHKLLTHIISKLPKKINSYHEIFLEEEVYYAFLLYKHIIKLLLMEQ